MKTAKLNSMIKLIQQRFAACFFVCVCVLGNSIDIFLNSSSQVLGPQLCSSPHSLFGTSSQQSATAA